ncbi:MAG: hypothetical protein ACKV2Q_07130 [Planctomycetaceae bacterium]
MNQRSQHVLSLTTLILILVASNAATLMAQQEAKVVEFVVAGANLRVPYPAGFAAKKNELKTFVKRMSAVSPNTIHEVFAAKEIDEATMLRTGLRRHADIQTTKEIGAADQNLFDELKKLFETQFDQIIAQAAKDIKDKTGLALKTQEKVGKGTFINKPDRYAYLFFSTVDAGNGKTVERASALCLAFVKDRIILLNVHSDLESEKDATWVKTESEKWLEAVCKANQAR